MTRLIALVCALLVSRLVAPWWCGRDANRWLAGDPRIGLELGEQLVAFEAADDHARVSTAKDRFSGEWALVTHQMTALGLAQLCLAHPEERALSRPK